MFAELRFFRCWSRRGWLLALGLFLGLGGRLSCRSQSPALTSETLVPGVTHHAIYLLQGPWSIHVIEVDLPRAWKEGIRLRTTRADPALGGSEKTSSMAAAAIAAINGDFFYASGRTAGIQIRDGILLQEPQVRSAFAIAADGRPLIAVFRSEAGLITSSGQVVPIAAFNRRRAARGVILYDHFVQTWLDSVHAALGFQLQNLGRGLVIDERIPARVLQVRHRRWPLRLDPDQWLVAAESDVLPEESIAPGDTVQLYFKLPPATQALQEAIGGGPRIIRDGAVSIEYEQEHLDYSFATDRHPRTAIGYARNQETLFLVTVDGRQPGYSVGMSREELAEFMRHRLADFSVARAGAYQALNLDGGGSTTMVVRRRVVNRPSGQTGERPVANALLVVGPTGAGPGSDSSL